MDISQIAGNNFLIFSVLVFVSVLLLVEGAVSMWRAHKGPEASRLKRRLQALAATSDRSEQTRILKQRLLSETPGLERFLQRLPRLQQLDRHLLQSGLKWTVSGLLLGSLVLAMAGWAGMSEIAPQSRLLAAMAALAGAAAPLAYVSWRRARRLRHMERQLPEVLDLITRALRAGHAFTSALSMAGTEMPEPIGGEFRTVHDEINFGVSLQQALTHLSERVPLTDLRYFVVAVLIQRDSGGNLTEILTNLSRLLRERAKLMAKIRVLSAEGRLSAWILGLMPFALAGVMNLVNPEFMSLLWTDPIGIAMIQYMLVLMAIGALIMRKIVRIRV
ncbi:type II secretion system F family protein [Ramlibacter sp.]|uniref:type II secretion system F family protein n=1 Tax=Ramlibacter sp. TaxID=1917967 RepID=UPI002D252081|nr:type II secretion system F family protein [Ramlibacter sp.]HYD77923.1 type II secretion system F family protein [Ramlibacter sp.]